MSAENHQIRKFVPKCGQVDFTDIRWVPVVNCAVVFEEKVLLVQRSSDLSLYPNLWNGISGYLDDNKSLDEKIKEELLEEIGIEGNNIESIRLCGIFDKEDPENMKTWVVHSVLVKVASDKVILNWEGQKYAWVTPEKVNTFEIVPSFDRVLESAISNLQI